MNSRSYLIGAVLAVQVLGTTNALAEESATIAQIAGETPIKPIKEEKKPAPFSERYVICIYGAAGNLTAEINDQGRLIVAKQGTVLPSGEQVVGIEPNKAMVAKVSKDKKGKTTTGKPYAVWLQGAVGGPSATQGVPMPPVPGLSYFQGMTK